MKRTGIFTILLFTFLLGQTEDDYYELKLTMENPSFGQFFGSCLVMNGEYAAIYGDYALHSAYPNPFNPVTTIRYDLPKDSRVALRVYDIVGREVYRLIDENISAGYHSIQWEASGYSSGIYLIKIITPEYTATQKVLLLR